MDAFYTSTLAVALAEIGDKTQLLALLLTLRFSNKSALIAGILLATLVNHGLSAWFGTWLAQFLQAGWGEALMAASFIGLGLWLLVPDKADQQSHALDQFGAFLVAFVLFFVAEIGDKTQVATILLAAQFHSVLWVALGTSLGMLLANVPVIYAGQALIQRLPVTLAQRLAALVFIALGLGVVYYRLASG